MTKIEKATMESIACGGFTFKGDSHFRTYRQATVTLNRMERAGLIKREDHDQNMYVMTDLGRDVHKYGPNGMSVTDVAAWAAA
jgi:hypothetical protein